MNKSMRQRNREETALLLSLVWPCVLENLTTTLVSLVDTAMVGSAGAAATAAVGLCTSPTWLMNGLTRALGIGGMAMTARAVGARDHALAEHTAGSLEGFVEKMNQRAKELQMTATHFENVNGLDDTTENHVTSARDIAKMSRELLKHEKILEYTCIWMDTVRNGAFGLTNTNRLIRFYKGANGLKTGYTSRAKFCISATAKREGMQLIAVVMASPTSNERNATAVKLLDYGFANYERYRSSKTALSPLKVIGGKKTEVALCYEGLSVVLQKGEKSRVKEEIVLPEEIGAPVRKGQAVGTVRWTLDGKEIGMVEVCAAEEVKRLSFFDIFAKLFEYYTLF
jgi:D-alanyl-D-alanine carboxypeptidase (penicillin-binding protein 5/6)